MSTPKEGENPNISRQIVVDFSEARASESRNPFDAVQVQETTPQNVEEQEDPAVAEVEQEDTTDDVVDDTDTDTSNDTDTDTQLPDAEEDVAEDTDTDDDDEESSDVNPYFYLQNQLRTDGFIGEDVEFSEDVDGLSVYNAYKDKLKKDLEPAVRDEILNGLASQGYNESDLVIARALRSGIDPRLLSQVGAYEVYASIPEDSDEDTKISAIKAMYQSRGIKPKEAEALLTVAQESENVDEIFKESKQFFTDSYNSFVEQQAQLEEQQKKQAEESQQQALELVRNIVSSREILGEKLTATQAKEFEDAITKQTEVVEVNGAKYRVSEMEKFISDVQTDPNIMLYLFKKWKFRGQEEDAIKKEVKKEVEDDFLSEYETKVVKRKSKATKNKNKAIKTQLEKNKEKGQQYFVGF